MAARGDAIDRSQFAWADSTFFSRSAQEMGAIGDAADEEVKRFRRKFDFLLVRLHGVHFLGTSALLGFRTFFFN